ncbi:MAG: hypothetical protein HY685_05215 [Chloroflexi bacterium]|nr:hypothetical protein [Chloroflexota bacterium]
MLRVLRYTPLLPLLFAFPRTASAHAFGERYDLPVPLGLYLAGAGATVAVSFLLIGLFVKGSPGARGYPRYNLLHLPWARALVARPFILLPLRLASVALLVLVLVTGLVGDQSPAANLAPTFVWIVWWIGLGFLVALVGDVWAALNPWKAAFEALEGLFARLTKGQPLSLGIHYPPRFGVWPAFGVFFIFLWMENVMPGSAVPRSIALLALAYSLYTWTGMLLFGKHVWPRYGEGFSVFFRFLARLAPTEVRTLDRTVCQECPLGCRVESGECINCLRCFAATQRREVNLRPPAIGLIHESVQGPDEVSFVLLMLAGVTFDGFNDTPLWITIASSFVPYLSFLPGDFLLVAIGTLGLGGLLALFLGGYAAVSWLIRSLSRDPGSLQRVMWSFVFTLVPIAFAYHVAHYLSFLLIQGQLLFPLLSDPFGYGWDLFGTAGYKVNIGVINARTAWFVGIGALVTGHIVAVYLSHLVALRQNMQRSLALRGQYPMLALMVSYTVISLWILAQPIVKE